MRGHRSFPVLGLVLLGLVSGPGAGVAHDRWWNGKEVDPVTKRVCCGDNDVKHLEKTQVRVLPSGYQLLDTGEIVAFDHAQPSVDGEYWVFRWGNPRQTQCFFAPPPAT